ncbi:hypothetical protein [Humibacter ginsenosidimutans]|uniref:DUF3592 domain-containing protein n=1 Tax=Humibacter ginsenosidimutans TaxID=2599293 RepID=A0A5B8M4U2_9MICO|nr:hypothetical protein [Humibacter ginsenosidimutans]QDZ15019.1 hypothetical protein FPZ11_09785 [Humibacter ginsenosidimutans]
MNLLGTPEQATAVTDADRRRYAIGPFGQAWLWTFAVFLTAQGLYKAIVGPIIAASLPTVPGTVVDWIAVPGRALTFVPKIAYEVAGNQYTVVSGTAITTKVHAPTTVTVSYLPMDPSVSIWTSGEWWQGFFDTYLMVTLILGLILLGAAMYQSRIGRYWSPRFPASNAARSTLFIVIGVVLAAAGVAWAVSGYLLPGGAVIPPGAERSRRARRRIRRRDADGGHVLQTDSWRLVCPETSVTRGTLDLGARPRQKG